MISVCFAHFLAGIYRCVVGDGLAVSSAMKAAERFLLRSIRKVEVATNLTDVSIICTRTLLRAICCSLFFQFFLGLVVVLVAGRFVCVEFVVVLVSAAVGVAIHGVEGYLSPEDQIRYASCLHV